MIAVKSAVVLARSRKAQKRSFRHQSTYNSCRITGTPVESSGQTLGQREGALAVVVRHDAPLFDAFEAL